MTELEGAATETKRRGRQKKPEVKVRCDGCGIMFVPSAVVKSRLKHGIIRNVYHDMACFRNKIPTYKNLLKNGTGIKVLAAQILTLPEAETWLKENQEWLGKKPVSAESLKAAAMFGRLESVKRGGVWFTTADDLVNYAAREKIKPVKNVPAKD